MLTFQRERSDYFIQGTINPNETNREYKTDEKYFYKDDCQIFFIVTKNPLRYSILRESCNSGMILL